MSFFEIDRWRMLSHVNTTFLDNTNRLIYEPPVGGHIKIDINKIDPTLS